MTKWIFLFVVFASFLSAPLTAVLQPEPEPEAIADPVIKDRRGLLPGVFALVPGLVWHGSGHFLAGHSKTGWRLVGAQWSGLGLMFAGLLTLAISGAAPEFNPPAIWLLIGGGLLFQASWFADIYGAFGVEKIAGSAPTTIPGLAISQGVMVVSNPVLDPVLFGKTRVTGTLGRWGLQLDAFAHVGGDDVRADGTARYRIAGRRRSSERDALYDATSLDWAFGYRFHQYDKRRLSEHTASTEVIARYDLRRIGPTLRGSFIDASAGVGFAAYRYLEVDRDEVSDLLLATIGFGFYLAGDDGWGEARLYYDHRHDGYRGGAKLRGLGSGAAGSANVRISRSLFGRWGFELGGALGSGYVADLSVVYRFIE